MEKQALLSQLAYYFTHQIPFNQLIGLEVRKLTTEEIEVFVPMSEQLIGNTVQKILHGGVSASILDVTGVLMAAAATIVQNDHLDEAELQQKIAKIGTINLRTDYLRPGRGDYFRANAEVIRSGNKVAVTKMELYNDLGEHIATGTGTYLTG